jgi:DNA-binding MarR family transcriptional regulator
VIDKNPSAFGVAGEETGKMSPLSPEACFLRHVTRTSRAVVAAYDPALVPYGLTGHQFNLMMTLSRLGPMSVGALASSLGMDPSGVPRAIRSLVDGGSIEVTRGTDKRQRMLTITSTGQQLLDRATPAWRAVQEELANAFGGARWTGLVGELRDMRRAAAACSTRTARTDETSPNVNGI